MKEYTDRIDLLISGLDILNNDLGCVGCYKDPNRMRRKSAAKLNIRRAILALKEAKEFLY